MGIARSSFYADPAPAGDDTALVEAMHAIKDEFEAYGWRRMQAALRQCGWVVNHKKIKRLMREHDLNPVPRRRFVATTDSNQDQPIFPDRAREFAVEGPNQLRRPHLCRDHRGLRLRCADHGRLVPTHRRLRDRRQDRRPPHARCP